MSEQNEERQDRSYENELYPEDQKKVDEFTSTGINSVERKPFRPMLMMGLLIVVVTGLSAISLLLARYAGAY